MICFDQSTAIALFAFSMASAVMVIWSWVLGGAPRCCWPILVPTQ